MICQIGRSKDGERGWVGGGGGASHQGNRHTRLQLLHQGYPTLELLSDQLKYTNRSVLKSYKTATPLSRSS